MRCPSRKTTDEQRIPTHLRRAIEGTVSSFHQRFFQIGEEGGDVVAQVDEMGEQAWRVWVRPAPSGAAPAPGLPLVALQMTTVYLLEVLRTIGRRQYDLGLLRCLEVVCTRSLQMEVALDEQIGHLLASYSLGWGRRRPLSPRLHAEVPPSALATTRCFSPEDRLWTIRPLGGPGGATVGGPEALVLLHGRQLALVSQWTVFLDQVFARQQQELQRVLDRGLAALSHLQAGDRARITAFGSLDQRTLATIDPRAERGWQLEVQMHPCSAGGDHAPRPDVLWGSNDLVVLVLQQRGKGGLSTINFRPAGLDQVMQAMAAHTHRNAGDA